MKKFKTKALKLKRAGFGHIKSGRKKKRRY